MTDIEKQRENLEAAMYLHTAGAISTQQIVKMLGLDFNDLQSDALSEQRNMDFEAWAAYKKGLIKRFISALTPFMFFMAGVLSTIIIRHIFLHK